MTEYRYTREYVTNFIRGSLSYWERLKESDSLKGLPASPFQMGMITAFRMALNAIDARQPEDGGDKA